jgi:hypothetical protein
MRISLQKVQSGVAPARLEKSGMREVDANPEARLNEGKKIASPAADLEHPLSRRDDLSVNLSQPAMVIA